MSTARQIDIGKLLSAASLIFWDFDGVIKDSVEAKSDAFETLFLPYGCAVAARVRKHHEANGGVSRFEKIPLYLAWVEEPATDARVREFCEHFSALAMQAVIDSPWVPGVREYLANHHTRQYFVLVSATPQDEIQQILDALDLTHCFREIHGAPKKKADALKDVLSHLQLNPSQAIMVGDAETDLIAAQNHDVPFLLRRTLFNRDLQDRFAGPMFENLTHE
ncbi:HAD family hydrolase [Sulfuritalea hydrogenivorans]|uniref:phosphoglycolate phosphatase n=1 Tax=Sulfuritalea hydrogenivorans sk43H TaxID=1223802 RepID=W0SK63_9PROT|nr:HAD family hydrolase [Sulfuritalea hydrogenivorans]BAO31130.1 putative phosphatase [Sulfuritalea hydrogenivorans sk43H]